MALALSFALTGHAISTPRPMLHVLLDAIHVMAAGGWLGTLLVVATIGLYTALMLPVERRAHAASELIGAFSSFALLCAGTLVVTGVIQAWSHLPTLSALWQTHYGQALFRKLVVIASHRVGGRVQLARGEAAPLESGDDLASAKKRDSGAHDRARRRDSHGDSRGTSPPDADDAMPSMESSAAPMVSAAPSPYM